MRERQALLDLVNVGRMKLLPMAEATTPVGRLAGKQVTHAGVAAHDFAAGANLEALRHRLFCFDTLGATHKWPELYSLKGGQHRGELRRCKGNFSLRVSFLARSPVARVSLA